MHSQPMYPPNPASAPIYNQQAQNVMYHPYITSPPYNTPSQSSMIRSFHLDDNLEPLWGAASQSYQPFSSQDSEGPSQPVRDKSHVEEVTTPVNRKSTKRPQQSKKNDKDVADPWSLEEEVALCKAWVDVSENSVEGNARKGRGFGRKYINTF
ncbi:hypothetical protein Tco_0818280 [Tanacetum coccineum]